MAVLGPGDGGSSTSGSTGNRSGAGTGTGASGKIKPVEIIPIAGGSTITIGGARFPGVTEAEQSGGVNAPTKRTEEGYDYTTRVNREARTASFSGWVKAAGLVVLRRETSDTAQRAESFCLKPLAKRTDQDIRDRTAFPRTHLSSETRIEC